VRALLHSIVDEEGPGPAGLARRAHRRRPARRSARSSSPPSSRSSWVAAPRGATAPGSTQAHVNVACSRRRMIAPAGPRPRRPALMVGSTEARAGAELAVVGGHVAPAQQGLALLVHDRVQEGAHLVSLHRLARQEDQADAVLAEGGSAMPSRRHSRRRKRSGICTRMPAPSPVFGPAPQAPRCRRFLAPGALSPRSRGKRRPLMSTTKPTPQEVVCS